MQRSFLWPECLSGENTILGFPPAVCMIPEGRDHKDSKGILGPGEEMKSSPLPLDVCVLCVPQPGDLGGWAYPWLQVYAGGSNFKGLWDLNKGLRLSFAIERQPKIVVQSPSYSKKQDSERIGNHLQLKGIGIPLRPQIKPSERRGTEYHTRGNSLTKISLTITSSDSHPLKLA